MLTHQRMNSTVNTSFGHQEIQSTGAGIYKWTFSKTERVLFGMSDSHQRGDRAFIFLKGVTAYGLIGQSKIFVRAGNHNRSYIPFEIPKNCAIGLILDLKSIFVSSQGARVLN